MPSSGYQDWLRVQRAIGEVVFSWNASSGAAIQTAPLNVAAWGALNVNLYPFTAGTALRLTLQWYSDAAGDFPLGTNTYIVAVATTAQFNVPCMSGYVSIKLESHTGGWNNSIVFVVYGMATAFRQVTPYPGAFPIYLDAPNLAINQTYSAVLNTWYQGWVAINCHAFVDSSISFTLSYYDWNSSSYIEYFEMNVPLDPLSNTVQWYLPGTSIQAKFFNHGNAQLAKASIVPLGS